MDIKKWFWEKFHRHKWKTISVNYVGDGEYCVVEECELCHKSRNYFVGSRYTD